MLIYVVPVASVKSYTWCCFFADRGLSLHLRNVIMHRFKSQLKNGLKNSLFSPS